MIVRLKEGVQDSFVLFNLAFQFYDSPIKSFQAVWAYALLQSFNSMIVRLKERFAML